ncbi:MAG TPA: hypothetical protein VFX04_04730 [Rhodanobacteraceae bacterium]|nr:hypothetical protein [Rhodanobacteraceae bacterium]
MSHRPVAAGDHATRKGEGAGARLVGAANLLHLAATPTFVAMALLTGVIGGGTMDMLCQAARGMSPLSGMTLMYLLMGAFHSTPWLKVISARRINAHRSAQTR